jgi:hypothetical protein
MKYLRKFETKAEYIAYKNSEDFIKPNVTYVASNRKVFFTPIKNTTDSEYTIFEVSDGEFEVTDGTFEVLK